MNTCLELVRSVLRASPRAFIAHAAPARADRRAAALALGACIALAAPASVRAWSWPLDPESPPGRAPCAEVARPRSFDELLWGWKSQMLERLRRVRVGASWVAWGDPGTDDGRAARVLAGVPIAPACRDRRRELDETAAYGFGSLGFLSRAVPVGGAVLVLQVSLPEGFRAPLPLGYARGVMAPQGHDAEAARDDELGLHGSDWKRFEPLSLGFEDGISLLAPRGYRSRSDSAFGVEYRMLPRWSVRAGARLDRTALPAELESLQPDDPRMRVGLGLTYAPLAMLEFDLAYLRVFAADGSLRVLGDRDEFVPALGSPLRIDTDDDLFGVTLRVRF